jgi:hypothetical protein
VGRNRSHKFDITAERESQKPLFCRLEWHLDWRREQRDTYGSLETSNRMLWSGGSESPTAVIYGIATAVCRNGNTIGIETKSGGSFASSKTHLRRAPDKCVMPPSCFDVSLN